MNIFCAFLFNFPKKKYQKQHVKGLKGFIELNLI